MVRVTPLLASLRALTADQRKAFSEETGTTVVYLYQLAGQPWPNPKLRMAKPLWSRSMLDAIKEGVISAQQRFTFHSLRRYYVTMHRDQTGELPDLHADKRITSRVYDATKEIGRKAL